ncbi:MAG: hypothetical protein P8Y99_10530 [Calditrichaceae bacterium]
MSQKFYEIVLEGNFMLVRGFVLGFLASEKPGGSFFFHRKSGIRRETLKEFLKEFFEMENHVHFCLEGDLIDEFKKAIEYYEEETDMKIRSMKEIKGAKFSFSYKIYNEKLAKEAEDLFSNLPNGLNVKNYKPVEKVDKDGEGMEGGYAPLHEFTSEGNGVIEGEFGKVIDLFLKIKRSELSESIICSDVDLKF